MKVERDVVASVLKLSGKMASLWIDLPKIRFSGQIFLGLTERTIARCLLQCCV